ncbi:hypothetical protein ABIC11_005066 [Pseudomonas oryzihabitans]
MPSPRIKLAQIGRGSGHQWLFRIGAYEYQKSYDSERAAVASAERLLFTLFRDIADEQVLAALRRGDTALAMRYAERSKLLPHGDFKCTSVTSIIQRHPTPGTTKQMPAPVVSSASGFPVPTLFEQIKQLGPALAAAVEQLQPFAVHGSAELQIRLDLFALGQQLFNLTQYLACHLLGAQRCFPRLQIGRLRQR